MTSSTETRAHGDYEEEMRLRRSVVADGYSSAHSCQHCEELVIVPRKLYLGPEYEKEVNETVVSREEVRQRAAAGCKLWSLVSDEVDYEILKHKRKSLAGMQKFRHHNMSVPRYSSDSVSYANTQLESPGP